MLALFIQLYSSTAHFNIRQIGTLFNQTPRKAYVHTTPDATYGIKNTPLFFIFCRYAVINSNIFENIISLVTCCIKKTQITISANKSHAGIYNSHKAAMHISK